MEVRVLASNGGPHPASQWANITASEIARLIEVAPEAPAEAHIQKQDYCGRLLKILLGHYIVTQQIERRCLAQDAQHDKNPFGYGHEAPDPVIDAIINAAHGTAFGEHFKRADVRDHIASVLANHTATVMDIERKWHRDRRPT